MISTFICLVYTIIVGNIIITKSIVIARSVEQSGYTQCCFYFHYMVKKTQAEHNGLPIYIVRRAALTRTRMGERRSVTGAPRPGGSFRFPVCLLADPTRRVGNPAMPLSWF